METPTFCAKGHILLVTNKMEDVFPEDPAFIVKLNESTVVLKKNETARIALVTLIHNMIVRSDDLFRRDGSEQQ